MMLDASQGGLCCDNPDLVTKYFPTGLHSG